MHREESPSDSGAVEVPPTALAPDTLRRVIEEFVTREGTDYGLEVPLDEKVREVRDQLKRGTAVIFFDPVTEGVTIVSRPK